MIDCYRNESTIYSNRILFNADPSRTIADIVQKNHIIVSVHLI